MSYNKRPWANGDLITKERMNNIEDGIYDAHDKINAINNKVEENTTDTNTARQDISDIKLQIGTEELTTTSKKIKGAINELGSQIKDIEIFKFGAKGMEGVDDTEAIQRYLDSLGDEDTHKTLYIPKNFVFSVNNLIINRKNLTIKGGGSIKGTVKIIFDSITYANIKFQDITFIQDTKNQENCIEIENTFNLYFDNCTFKNGKAGIFFTDKGYKHSGYMKITNCIFNINNYGILLKNDSSNYGGYQIADILVSECYFYSTQITGIHLVGVDGITISNNTLFFASFRLQEVNKTNNIYIKTSNFVIIENNNLFESGAESILLEKYKNSNINNNNIAWSGQRIKSSSIYLCGTEKGDDSQFVNTTIEGNNINCPSFAGIKISGYVVGLLVTDNNIVFDGQNQYYYGNDTINLEDRRSIITDSEVKENCLFANNIYPNSIDDIYIPSSMVKGTRIKNNFSRYGLVNKDYCAFNINSKNEEITVNYTDNTLLGYNYIILSGSNRINIINFGKDNRFDYNIITIISFCSDVVFTNGQGIMLKKYDENTLGANKIKKFQYYNGTWFEI